jgi:hypothetical protein
MTGGDVPLVSLRRGSYRLSIDTELGAFYYEARPMSRMCRRSAPAESNERPQTSHTYDSSPLVFPVADITW